MNATDFQSVLKIRAKTFIGLAGLVASGKYGYLVHNGLVKTHEMIIKKNYTNGKSC